MSELIHYGVLGMRWGVRKDGKPQGFQYGGNNKKSSLEIPKQKKQHTIDYDLVRVNAGKDKNGRTRNCTMCTAAYDMRRRGYNVTAGLNKETEYVLIGPEQFEEWYSDIESVYVKPTLTDRKVYNKKAEDRYKFYKKHPEEYIAAQKQMQEDTINAILSQGDGARGKIGVLWQNSDIAGHSLQYEVQGNGVQILDAQIGSRVNADELFAKADPTKGVAIYRLDTAKPNYEVMVNQGIIDYPGANAHPMPSRAEFPEMSDFYKQNGMDAFIERYGPTQVSRINEEMKRRDLTYLDDLIQYLED